MCPEDILAGDMTLPQQSKNNHLLVWLICTVVLGVPMWFALRTFSPSPPRMLTMSTGAPEGAYHQFGLKYQQLLKENGVTLELKSSAGSFENLQRLTDGSVDVGLVQGGLGVLTQDSKRDEFDTRLRTLVTVAYEPVWIFSRKLDLSNGLAPLLGKRVSIGLPNSGTNKLALELLKSFGVVSPLGLPLAGTQLLNEGGMTAAKHLQDGELDVLMLVAAPEASVINHLLSDTNVELASMRQVEGLSRRLPYFQPVSLKFGSVDPERNIPSRDVALIATTANLVIQEDLHPALAYLLLEAAQQAHARPSLLSRPGEFPGTQGTDFPLARETERYLKNGRPLLQRYLPFWIANFVQRTILFILPMLALLVPMFTVMPTVLNWKQKNRLFNRYGEIKFIESSILSRTLSEDEISETYQRLDKIEQEIIGTRFALAYSDRVYTLRQHLDFVRGKLGNIAKAKPAEAPIPGAEPQPPEPTTTP